MTSAGTAIAWGENAYGNLGDGTTTTRITPVTVALPSGTTATSVSASNAQSLALSSTGSVFAWGFNAWGQLGDGTTTDRHTPVSVALPAGTNVIAISAGDYHSLALTSTGAVFAWGRNADGQLGNGTTTNSTTPVSVALPTGATVTGISAGGSHNLALTSSGSILAWGFNSSGELGDGTTTNRTTPVTVAVPTAMTVSAVSARYSHSLAKTSTGGVLSWGENNFGQVGDGTTVNRSLPVSVALPADTTASAVAAGYLHSLMITSTGDVLAWGYNGSGQLGDGTTTARTTPVNTVLGGDTRVAGVAAGYHSLALVDASPPPPPSSLQWVQLGDSFSAGVGLGKVTAGCDQDDGAYTPVAYSKLNRKRIINSDVLINVSCSGATTADYWASQASFVGDEADIATLTIGGNDTFLAAKVFGCYIGRCGPDVFGVEAGTENQKVTWDQIFGRLVDVYFDVRTNMSSEGHLYVLSYPIPFGLGSGADCNGFEYDEQMAANAFSTRLGDTVHRAVEAANTLLVQSGRPGNVHFLDWRTGTRVENLYEVPPGFPNAGQRYPVVVSPNGLCSRDGKAFLNGYVRTSSFMNSFHPNRYGYGHVAGLLETAVVTNFG